MKKTPLLFIICFKCILTFSQVNEIISEQLVDSLYPLNNKDYLDIRVVKDKKLITYIFLTQSNKKNILEIKHGDSKSIFMLMNKTDLFKFVKENIKFIRKTQSYLNSNYQNHEYNKKFINGINIYSNLGIKYKNLHYNHFPKFTIEEIESKKNKKLKKGMEVINKLYEILEEAEKK